jgi:hypothetical protein
MRRLPRHARQRAYRCRQPGPHGSDLEPTTHRGGFDWTLLARQRALGNAEQSANRRVPLDHRASTVEHHHAIAADVLQRQRHAPALARHLALVLDGAGDVLDGQHRAVFVNPHQLQQ